MSDLKYIIAFLLAAGIFSSCEKAYYKPLTVSISPNDTIHFATDIKPFLAGNCAKSGCHDAGTKTKGLNFEAAASYTTINDFSLVDTTNAEQSLMYVKINSGTMKQYATPEFTAKLLIWIKQGAQDN